MKRKGITARDLMPHLAAKEPELVLKPEEAVRRLKALRAAIARLARETGQETYRRDVLAIDEAIEAMSEKG